MLFAARMLRTYFVPFLNPEKALFGCRFHARKRGARKRKNVVKDVVTWGAASADEYGGLLEGHP
jgi:hypothetical protein